MRTEDVLFLTIEIVSIKEPYPSPGSGSVVAALPASTSDAIFQINENKKHREMLVGGWTSGLLPGELPAAATPQVPK